MDERIRKGADSDDAETRSRPLLIASDSASMSSLAEILDADLVSVPNSTDREVLESWREEAMGGAAHENVVVCVWSEDVAATPLLEFDDTAWERRFEAPFLLWNLALGVAARRCRAGGAIATLVQTPSAMDAAGYCTEMSIADGVIALTRSLAASEGPRGVRANVVTTPLSLIEAAICAPPPPLENFPGRLDVEVVGALRLTLSADALGLTGRVLAADGGRSLA